MATAGAPEVQGLTAAVSLTMAIASASAGAGGVVPQQLLSMVSPFRWERKQGHGRPVPGLSSGGGHGIRWSLDLRWPLGLDQPPRDYGSKVVLWQRVGQHCICFSFCICPDHLQQLKDAVVHTPPPKQRGSFAVAYNCYWVALYASGLTSRSSPPWARAASAAWCWLVIAWTTSSWPSNRWGW